MTNQELKEEFIKINNSILKALDVAQDFTKMCDTSDPMYKYVVSPLEGLQDHIASDILKYWKEEPQEPVKKTTLAEACQMGIESQKKIDNLVAENLRFENMIDSYKAVIIRLACPNYAEAVEDLADMLETAASELEQNKAALEALGVDATEQRKLQAEYLDQHKK